MGMRFTARPTLGPLRLGTGSRGLASVSLTLGPLTWRLWSRRSRAGLASVDLPGPWSVRPCARRRSR